MSHSQTSENIDASEIARFSALASRWWDTQGAMKALHDINPLRANYIDQHANIAGKTLLDVGCGGGILAEAMARRGAHVSAIDASEEAINVAKLHLLESNLTIDYQHSTAEQFAQNSQSFDIITCLEMLEHVPDPQSVISACAALCKPNGQLFFSTINRNAKAWLMMIIGAEYVMDMVPKGTHHYEKFIRPAELAQCLRRAGLQLEHITGMSYQPFTKQYQLSADTDVNYLVCARKLA